MTLNRSRFSGSDLPDLGSSVENIQVQRGAGTSSNGAGAFGGNDQHSD